MLPPAPRRSLGFHGVDGRAWGVPEAPTFWHARLRKARCARPAAGGYAGDFRNLRRRPHLWHHWLRTPTKGEIAIFDHSWYRRILNDRAEGLAGRAVGQGRRIPRRQRALFLVEGRVQLAQLFKGSIRTRESVLLCTIYVDDEVREEAPLGGLDRAPVTLVGDLVLLGM